MSAISSIYAALAAKTVTVGAFTPTVYTLATLPNGISSAQLPCRLLLPLGDIANEGRDVEFIATGATITVNWQIKDLLLWAPATHGLGVRSYAPDLVAYAGAYVDMLRTFKGPSTQSNLESASVIPGVYRYPGGEGGIDYVGALCTLQIMEVLNG